MARSTGSIGHPLPSAPAPANPRWAAPKWAVSAWAVVARAARAFIADDALSLGGALAFYAALSLAPLLVVLVAVAGALWQEDEIRTEIVRYSHELIGADGADAVAALMRAAGEQKQHGPAAVFGIATGVFGATSVFAQLQYSLNRVWNVEAKPGDDVMDFLRKRLFSLGIILVMALLLVASLVASAALSVVAASTLFHLPGGNGVWRIVELGTSLAVYTGVFTLLHHFLPDVKVSWKDSLVGGAVTAVLFSVGKELLGYYLGKSGVATPYGAAGSFFVVLLWVYYSSLILFIGAEITQAFAEQMGHPVEPDAHARRMAPPCAEPRAAGPSTRLTPS